MRSQKNLCALLSLFALLISASCALIISACEAESPENFDAHSPHDSGEPAGDVTDANDATDAAVEEISELDAEKAEPDATWRRARGATRSSPIMSTATRTPPASI